MLIPLKDILLIYEKMMEQIKIDAISVVIYTATDVDALCSLKMITKFFQLDSIKYKVYTVTTYTELQNQIEESKQNQKVKLFMFINCGGFIDLTQKWFCQQQINIKIILLDVNKPVFHKNVQSQSIYIINDGYGGFQNMITEQDLKKLDEMEELNLDEEIQKYQENQSQSNQNSPKRSAGYILTQKLKKSKQLLQKKFQNYYQNTSFSLPTSYSIYQLIAGLNKTKKSILWFGIVGLTSMYLERNLDKDTLQKVSQFYKLQMRKINSFNNDKRQEGEIFDKKDFQFPLMNHWSLYESMMNSSYLMVKLGLWGDQGITKLHEILTKIGISLDQAKHQYQYMTKDVKDKIQENIYPIAEDYNMPEITFNSFMRQVDSSNAYSASDFYYIISSILQKPAHKSTLEEMSKHRVDCFWEVYSLLEGNQKMIQTALQQYKEHSRILMKQVKQTIQRDGIINIKKVDFSNIRCDTKDKRLFQHPKILMKLAYMLMGIQKNRRQELKKNVSLIPYVAALTDIEKNICLLAGVVPSSRNYIGTKFNAVAQKLEIQTSHDFFLSNVIYISKDNLGSFLAQMGKKNQ